jgi:hypothetical protein
MKTIAEQLNIKEFPFIIRDKNGRILYFEDSNNFWSKYERDERGNVCFYETSEGFSYTCEYDEDNNEIYYKNSSGTIRDNRIKKMSKKEAEKQFKIKII